MRTLHADLTAAQKASPAVPVVGAVAYNRLAGITHYKYTRHYTGGAEDNLFHAVAIPANGTLCRFAIISAGAAHLAYNINAAPDDSSDYATWIAFGGGLNYYTDVPIAAAASGTEVVVFAQDTSNVIWVHVSSDSGATFAARASLGAASAKAKAMGAAYDAAGDLYLFWSNGVDVFVNKRASGTWAGFDGVNWGVITHNVVTDLGVSYDTANGEFNLLVTGTLVTSIDKVLTSIKCSDATPPVWSSQGTVASAVGGSPVSFFAPFMVHADTLRAWYVEYFSGTPAVYQPFQIYLPSGQAFGILWHEQIPFDFASRYGVSCAWDGTSIWLSHPWGVWQGTDAESPSLDMSADIVYMKEEITEGGAKLTIDLDNSSAAYDTPGVGADAALAKGNEIIPAFGYKTASGDRTSSGPRYYIVGWDLLVESPGKSITRLHAVGARDVVNDWSSKQTWLHSGLSVSAAFNWLMAKAGWNFDPTGASAAAGRAAGVGIHVAETGENVVRKLQALCPDGLRFDGVTGYLKDRLATEATVYDYAWNTTDHQILRANYSERSLPLNVVRAGSLVGTIEGFDYDYDELDQTWVRMGEVNDVFLTSQALAEERAAAIARKAGMQKYGGWIEIQPNVGQELFDCITVADGRRGLSSSNRRVLGITTVYEPNGRNPRTYRQYLSLGDR